MIGELDSRRSQGEQTPAGFEPIEEWPLTGIRDRLMRESTSSDTHGFKVVDGFEDILKGKPLGDGLYDNHTGGAFQLTFALSIFPNPAINQIANNTNLTSASEIIKQLREKQVLSGMKIIDLGCGSGSFALAAKSLGAGVYTTDIQDLRAEVKALLDGHFVVDLRDDDASEQLKRNTGGEFDLVTENIISPGPLAPRRLEKPTTENIVKIADVLLKKGGYLYYHPPRTTRTSTQVLRKK